MATGSDKRAKRRADTSVPKVVADPVKVSTAKAPGRIVSSPYKGLTKKIGAPGYVSLKRASSGPSESLLTSQRSRKKAAAPVVSDPVPSAPSAPSGLTYKGYDVLKGNPKRLAKEAVEDDVKKCKPRPEDNRPKRGGGSGKTFVPWCS